MYLFGAGPCRDWQGCDAATNDWRHRYPAHQGYTRVLQDVRTLPQQLARRCPKDAGCVETREVQVAREFTQSQQCRNHNLRNYDSL